LAFYDNVPIVSWLWLRGRCRRCSGSISARYPLVESATAVLFAALWSRWPKSPLWMGAVCAAAGLFIAVACIDAEHRIIPDEISLALLLLGLLVSPVNPFLRAASAPWYLAVLWSLWGAFFGFLAGWAVAAIGERIFKKEAMGGGDVKLLAAIGAWGGALGAFDALFIGSFWGALYGMWLIRRRLIDRRGAIPFGPFLSAGAIFNFFYLVPWGLWP
jgi:leader peptidase (prepilin peptidase)/N-methyltransferase